MSTSGGEGEITGAETHGITGGETHGEVIDLGAQTAVTGTSTRLTAYLSRPSTHGPWPGVVLVHEAFGLDEVMRGRSRPDSAQAGYLALMPDLFSASSSYRAGGTVRCLMATFAAMRSGRGRAFQDIEAARAWLVGQQDCTGRIGVIGFCMGGGFALLSAAGHGFDVSAVNYGMLPRDLESALQGACPSSGRLGGRTEG